MKLFARLELTVKLWYCPTFAWDRSEPKRWRSLSITASLSGAQAKMRACGGSGNSFWLCNGTIFPAPSVQMLELIYLSGLSRAHRSYLCLLVLRLSSTAVVTRCIPKFLKIFLAWDSMPANDYVNPGRAWFHTHCRYCHWGVYGPWIRVVARARGRPKSGAATMPQAAAADSGRSFTA